MQGGVRRRAEETNKTKQISGNYEEILYSYIGFSINKLNTVRSMYQSRKLVSLGLK